LGISGEPLYVPAAIVIALFNTINNSLNTLLFTIAGSNPTYISPYSIYIGATLYTIGILVEPISEVHRKTFKDKPENKGKPYAGGLFSLARNINYGA
jgi:steroid 5-alpha reductase family enzyme